MPFMPIAVIGLSGRYPGGAHDVDRLWANLKAGIDGVVDLPADRWDRGYEHPDRERKGRSYTYQAGYLDNVADFDADFFGMSPREAQQMDPQHRLLLELAWEALEDANVVPGALAGSRTGVFVGLSSRDYGDIAPDTTINAYTNLGLALSLAANRVSYVLDLKGPSFTVDTACSSGMVAVHQARLALESGECSMALVGAANLILSPRLHIGFSKASMLSPAGRCTAFDAHGAGYVRAEGGGMLLLKPLADAQRDGDRILGVLVASGVNSDGRTVGIALPNVDAQESLLRHVYGQAGVRPEHVWYVEAHGTGTAVGDPIECEALARVLAGPQRATGPLRIGSVKSNIGHLEPAAGIAGLTKVLLALKHGEVPANLHFSTPNPKIDFEGWRLQVVDRAMTLPPPGRPLLMGVNSFGFGGTNAHAVVQRYEGGPGARTAAPLPEPAPWTSLLVLSGQSPAALQAVTAQWQSLLQPLAGTGAGEGAGEGLDADAGDAEAVQHWRQLRATALHRRTHHPHRIVLHAQGPAQALQALQAHAEGMPSRHVATGKAPPHGRQRTAWVYGGNGPQWWGMGRELLLQDATFRAAVDDVDTLFRGLAGWSLVDELMRDEAGSQMQRTEVAQPTLFALQVGLTEVLRAAGLAPDAVFGHSVGEVAAAWASGALSLAQAVRVIQERSAAQGRTAGLGRMAALGIGAAEARRLIAEVGGFLELAAINSPSAVTVAGDPAQLERLVARVTEAGSFARVLALDYAFHTRTMDLIREPLHAALRGLAPGEACVPFVSTVEGGVVEGRSLGADYWWRNVREPVAFEAAAAHALDALQITGFVEIGPHPVLRDYLTQCAKARSVPATVLTTLKRPRGEAAEPETELLWQTVCAAHAAGMGDPLRLSPPPTVHVPLPLYPWQRTRHWRGGNVLPELRPPAQREHPLLGWRTSAASTVFENLADTHVLPWLVDHRIEDAVVFPGAGYIELGLAAARAALGDVPAQVEDLDFVKPMVIAEGPPPVLQLRADTDGTFEITSRPLLEATEATLHSRGRYTLAETAHRPAPLDIPEDWASLPVQVDAATHYAGSARRGLHYGPAFQGLLEMRLSGDDEALPHGAAWVELPPAPAAGLAAYRSHPALLDGCLQALITLLGHREARPCAYIPVRVDRLRCWAPLPRRVYCEVQVLQESERSGSARFVVRDAAGHCVLTLDSTRFQKVDFATAGGVMRLVDRWQRDTGSAARVAVPIALPDPARIADALPLPPSAEQPLVAHLDALIGVVAVEALHALGETAGLAADEPFTAGTLRRRARVDTEQVPLFEALLAMARADGWLLDAGGQLRWSDNTPPTATALWRAMALDSPVHVSELMLLAQLGERLPALLRGQVEPALPGAPGDRAQPAFAALLDTAPFRSGLHRGMALAVRHLAAQRPPGRTLRVLEVHAGGGGLTAAVLQALPAVGCDLLVTDRDDEAVERLAQRHGQASFVHAQHLDLADEAAVAALDQAFDLVLCGDPQACPLEPAELLQRLQSLLVPGGVLLCGTALPGRLPTLLFGQDPMWWRQDEAPLLGESAWQVLWSEAGWDAPAVVRDAEGRHLLWVAQRATADAAAQARADGVGQAPVAATAAATTPAAQRRWLLLTDASEAGTRFAADLALALSRRGQDVRCQAVHATGQAASDGSAATDDVAAFGRWLQSPLDVVVHLAGLAQPTAVQGHDADAQAAATAADAQLALQQLRCVPVFSLVQALKSDGPDAARRARPVLRIVTARALAGPAGAVDIDPAQVPVWGVARVLANEHADLAPRLVDLHASLDTALAGRLADELLRDDGETEVLLDAGDRWRRRVVTASPGSLAAEAAALPAARTTAVAASPALRLEAAAQGGLDALHLREVPRRAPAAGEVEVAVRAAGLNFRDVLWAMNMLPEEAVEAGFSGATVGMECAGEVVAVGDGVTGLAVGDHVIGFASGCFATHITTEAGALARIPAQLGWEAAATIPTTFLTAMYALDHLARLEPGEHVLVHGAAGGVGLAAVQIARLRGAVVYGTAGNDDKRRMLRLYGAHHVLDSRSLTYADDVMALTGGRGVDVVLNSLAGEAITKNLQILRPFGRMLEIGKRDFYANSRIGLRPFRNNLSYFGIDADTLLVERPELARKVFAQVAALFAQGQLHPLPYQALPIARAPQAFRLMQQSRHVGKIVITLPQGSEPVPAAVPADWSCDPAGAWLVTGGLGGFGLATARWLVSRGARRIALVGRRGPDTDEARAGIAALQAAGATVLACSGDVSRADDVARVLAEVRSGLGPLRGVVHSAMVLDDAPIVKLDGQRLRAVLAPKLAGAWHLHAMTQGDALDAFIVYSSATTVVGNPGQASYVAANLYLESLVQQRRAQGLPGLAVCWGSIKDVGVLTRVAHLDAAVQQRAGITSVPSEQALAELGRLLAARAGVVSVAQFNVQRLTELLATARAPRFAALAPQRGAAGDATSRQTLAERLPGTPPAERRDLVLDTLREQLGRILGTAASRIDLERQLPELGLDSLMAVELAQSLESEVGRPVSVMQMIQASSAVAVGDLLLAGFEQTADA